MSKVRPIVAILLLNGSSKSRSSKYKAGVCDEICPRLRELAPTPAASHRKPCGNNHATLDPPHRQSLHNLFILDGIKNAISGSYGFLNEAGALEVVSYKSKNGTGFEILEEGLAQQQPQVPQQPQQQPTQSPPPQPQPQNPLFAAEVPQRQVMLNWNVELVPTGSNSK